MYGKVVAAALIMGWLCLSGQLAFTHHSVAVNFDQSKVVEVTGRVKEVDIRNPHSQITLEVVSADGKVVEWFIEWSDKNSLIRRSVPYERIRVGDRVTISASLSRRLPNVGYYRTAVLPDGSTLLDCGFGAFRESVANSTKITC